MESPFTPSEGVPCHERHLNAVRIKHFLCQKSLPITTGFKMFSTDRKNRNGQKLAKNVINVTDCTEPIREKIKRHGGRKIG